LAISTSLPSNPINAAIVLASPRRRPSLQPLQCRDSRLKPREVLGLSLDLLAKGVVLGKRSAHRFEVADELRIAAVARVSLGS
jgi:hypothetical protein